jgi:hypothetical protein
MGRHEIAGDPVKAQGRERPNETEDGSNQCHREAQLLWSHT